ncbi:flippase-like domain-containing protein [Flagellatimonas centrodinii]|uniref:lysylphosphatidylglycerol synthase domain-containing protein n=1 Tax=Flagellatimonas centrodinii TaxID=2806210 RepID=UPI001FEFDEB3|nr:lysylphosphatidylglycerol synthase domain-containing protein [Flagellatimonas centrodinii]ULQ46621.1 flippase-like domain-containing protein [Flagellatimonas centrodinii]
MSGVKRAIQFFRSGPIRWGILLTAVALLLLRLRVEGLDALDAINLSGWMAACAALLLGGYFLVFNERARVLSAQYLGRVPPLLDFARTLLVARVYNGLIPQTGNIYRAVSMRVELRLPYRGYVVISVATIAFELIVMGLAMIGLFSCLESSALWWRERIGEGDVPSMLIVLTVLLVLCGLAECGRQLRLVSGAREGSERSVRSDVGDFVRRVLSPSILLSGLFQSLVLLTAMVCVQWFVFAALGTRLDIAQALVFLVVNRLTQYVTVTPGNLGVRELMYGAIGATTAVGELLAVAASVLLRLLTWVVLGGLLATVVAASWRKTHQQR